MGLVQDAAQLKSQDGRITLNIASGTRLLDSLGNSLGSLNVVPLNPKPASPSNQAIILAYDFGPHGATFNPPLTMTLTYDPGELPPGIIEDNLHMAYFDGTKWIALESTVDPVTKTISAQVTHFSGYAVLGKVTPGSNPSNILTTSAAPTPALQPTITPSPLSSPSPSSTPVSPIIPSTPASETTTFNSGLLIGIIMAIVAILMIAVLLTRRKKNTKSS